MASTLPGLVSGAAFGAALTASGVYLPSVIISQLKFEDWHMIQSFLTATAGSALVAASLSRLGYAKFSPRGYSTLAIFGRADANVIGGALLGAGMALSGACPGTVASQTAVGITSGYWTLGGAILGGFAWTGFVRPWAARRRAAEDRCSSDERAAGAGSAAASPRLTVYEALGISYIAALVGFEVLMGFFVRAAGDVKLGELMAETTRPAGSSPVPPVVGGLFIAAAQLVSVLTRRSLIGTSGVFDEIGDFVWWLWSRISVTGPDSDTSKTPLRPKLKTAVFVSGIMLGSWTAATALPSLKDALVGGGAEIPPLQALLGGVSMVIGARMAGGCTSGHGISGMSLLSVSSIITIASAFLTGSIVANTVH